MKNSHIVKIDEWRKKHGLRKKEYVLLLECFRRIHMFKKDNTNKQRMVLLALPSEARPLKERKLIKPFSNEINKALNWYDLTDDGYHIIKDLELKWNKKEMNDYIFNL